MRICSIGECMIELSPANQNSYILGYAGDTANAAIYLSRLGASASYITSTGNDILSKSMIKSLQKENINISNIHINKKKSLGLYLIDNKINGERNFFYWRKNSAAKTFFENIDVNILIKKIIKFDAIYFSGITLSIYNSKNINIFYKVLTLAKKNGVKLYFDFNIRLNNWKSKEIANKLVLKFSKISNIIFITKEDLKNLGIRSYTKFILSNYKKKIVIFRSGNGKVVIYNKKFTYFSLSFEKKVKDTTGCGDAFNACFLYNYYKNNEIKKCLNFAHKLGKDVAKTKGAIIKKENFILKNYAI
jgi:2-dehydro-3-deoxygluconokinase